MDFTEIAMQKLGQTAPELVNLIVAFRDISEEAASDIDIAVGAFILQSGSEIFFVPVIQKDQTIHPIDSVFFTSIGQFRPLSKGTVSQILSSGKTEPGKKTKIPKGVSRNPSVYDLVTPPRTGKFVYASDSRVTEFFAAMPDHLKRFVRTRITDDNSLANSLHKMYDIEDVIDALKETAQTETKTVAEAPAKAVLTYGDALDEAQAREVIEKGYTLNSAYPHGNRVAIPQEEFEYHGQLHEVSPSTEKGKCFRIMLPNGSLTRGYVLPEAFSVPTVMGTGSSPYSTHKAPLHHHGIVLTESGRIMPIGRFIAVGDELVGAQTNTSVVADILAGFTKHVPLGTYSDLANGDYALVLDSDMKLIAAGTVGTIIHSALDSEVSLNTVDGRCKINFVPGLKSIITDASGSVSVPKQSIVIRCPQGYSCYSFAQECEKLTVAEARARLATQAQIALGDRLDIGFDGVDYSLNGSVAGPAHKAIEILIVNEGIEPNRAESLVKAAGERRSCRVLMSKKADFTPGEIPEFGDKPEPQQDPQLDGGKVEQAAKSGDKQISDAMILSELLQNQDLFGLISEYTPDIAQAVDRLGRILFMSRVRMDQLIQSSGSEAAMSTIASVKAVYRNLGDNLVKLEQLITNVQAS